MNRKQKYRLMAGTLAFTIFLTSCKHKLVLSRDNSINSTQKIISTTDLSDPSEEDIIDSIETVEAIETKPVIIDNAETTNLSETTEEQLIDQPLTEEVENKEETPENIIAYTTANLNLRNSNSTDALIITVLEENQKVYKMMSCDNNWDLVKVGDKIGYVNRDYLMYTDETYEQEHKIIFKNDVAVTTTELNFRSEPSTESEIIKTQVTTEQDIITEKDMVFKKNEELKVIAEVDDDWLLVEYNGCQGYVYKEYTISLLEKLQSMYPELGFEEFNLLKIVSPTCQLNIREKNTTESQSIRLLEPQESVRVLGIYDDWYLMMTNEHEFGFINKNYVEDINGKIIIIDDSMQRMYMYNNNERFVYTPVTTGKDSTPTDLGLHTVFYMDTDIYLNDDKDWVNYWMNYNGEGIHDAWWRQVYGEEDYHQNGSNGCTNTPYAAVKVIYENSKVGQKILVQK